MLVILLFAVLAGLAWFYSIARAALPQLDGSVKLSGLTAKVTVTRDTHGVPTIDASSFPDLFFAQGYVTAQDRLWQMDMMRRFAAGEISEILGADFIKHDREQRILGIRVAAEKALEVLSPQTLAHFDAYAGGVNAYIESHRDHLPIEFRILGYAPRPWSRRDSALIAAQMVKDLNHYPSGDALDREKILAKLGPELTADLYVNSSWHDRPPTVARPSLDQPPAKARAVTTMTMTMMIRTSNRRGAVRSPSMRSRPRLITSPKLCRMLLKPLCKSCVEIPAWSSAPTTGWFPALTPSRESRCSPMTCISATRCRTYGTKRIFAVRNPAAEIPAPAISTLLA